MSVTPLSIMQQFSGINDTAEHCCGAGAVRKEPPNICETDFGVQYGYTYFTKWHRLTNFSTFSKILVYAYTFDIQS
jgi:hypothetical protein